MGIENRKFPRVETDLTVAYEFVKWNEKKLDKLKKPIYTKIKDISARGIGLSNLEKITEHLIKQLQIGKKKARIAIFLEQDTPPLLTFARLMWFGSKKEDSQKTFGFQFIDVDQMFYNKMTDYINIHLK